MMPLDDACPIEGAINIAKGGTKDKTRAMQHKERVEKC